MYILIPDLKDCRFSCEEMQKCFIEITNTPLPTISSGWGMDRNIPISNIKIYFATFEGERSMLWKPNL